ncbi:hypothetical protein CASFOL_002056 [Castilleja foliolosa]|uniref:Coat protein n=1 Tax=Castilleja foliolosa TaxID=1961234 RepID=A0ABD3EGW4_9LAMI
MDLNADGPVPPVVPPPPHVAAQPDQTSVGCRHKSGPLGLVLPSKAPGPLVASPLLEIAAATPMRTIQLSNVNIFIPDAQMLFHVLSLCDSMMNSTNRFLKSSPAWLPIVSQLYVSVLWNTMILRVFVNSGYGTEYAHVLNLIRSHLCVDECMIPGPLVPFFQALSATKTPFNWIGDITPGLHSFRSMWNKTNFHPTAHVARQLPFPVIILDQLYAFAHFEPKNQNTSAYSTFRWYSNVFGLTDDVQNILHRMGPQLCGSLYTPQSQFDAARNIWKSIFQNGFNRVVHDKDAFKDFNQLMGFISQDGLVQTDWFSHISVVMQKYAQHFNESAPLKSVSLTGLGSVSVFGTPVKQTLIRDWIYPAATEISPFTTERYSPRREIPATFSVIFGHANQTLEEEDEQFSIVTYTNINLAANNSVQNGHTAIDHTVTHQGHYWTIRPIGESNPVNLKGQYAQFIANRYHQRTANRTT